MVYYLIWIFAWALQSNIQNSGHGWLLETSGKGFGIANFDFPHYYSWDYLKMDSFNSLSYLILHAWDSVPDGSSYGSISCLVWFLWWLRHGAMDPFEGTPLWETLHRPDFWIYIFNQVIHLFKVEQLAYFFGSCETSFFHFRSRDRPLPMQCTWDKGEGHACRCGITFFWFSWWGQPLVHPIRKIW